MYLYFKIPTYWSGFLWTFALRFLKVFSVIFLFGLAYAMWGL
jgi:hypothetical protein